MKNETTHGCCNATLIATLAAITARIATEQGRADPEFVRGLRVAKALIQGAGQAETRR
jgi:hypothetical protein